MWAKPADGSRRRWLIVAQHSKPGHYADTNLEGEEVGDLIQRQDRASAADDMCAIYSAQERREDVAVDRLIGRHLAAGELDRRDIQAIVDAIS